jgi:DNA primase catalytic subunit
MIPLNVTLSYYKRKDIQEEMVRAAENKEIAIRFEDKFGSRPDVLNNPNDILELAKQKATSFHCSEELWSNALQLNSNMKQHDIDELRIGWDLVLDIDCGIFEYSRIATDLIIKALKFNGVKSISCKFSGNKGFHIGVPFGAFPEKIRDEKIRDMFPDAARRIAFYIKELIKNPLGEKIMQYEGNNLSRIIEKTKKNADEIIHTKIYESAELDRRDTLNAEPFLEIDTLLISSRHLYRMPYSLHEKSGLVSVPINPDRVLEFEKEHAKPLRIKVSEFRFLDRECIRENDAKELIVQAFDYKPIVDETKMEENKKFEILEDAVPEELFPPCIKLGLEGLKDGRKRFVFTMINFLISAGWGYDAIEERLREWNKKNPESLREVNLLGQLRYHKHQKKKILPANCSNSSYYLDIGICRPDNLCSKIRNPVSYVIRKSKHLVKGGKKEKVGKER